MGRRLFGTDGVRGVANEHPMTIEIAMRIGQAVAYLFKSKNNKNKHHKILIGKDTRLSGYMFETALSAGLCSMGVKVLLVGPMPTPAIAFLTSSMRADAGVVISASHNPFEYNGIKIFSADGFKLPDEVEEEIEKLVIGENQSLIKLPTHENVGKAFRIEDAPGRYIVFLKNTFPQSLTLEGVKIVLDCANGAAYKVAPLVFEELGAQVITYGTNPNGININDNCGALHPELIKNAVLKHNADIGIALDGDADRVIVVDEKGDVVDGDHIMAICAKSMIEQQQLKKNTLVATVMSNMGLEIAMKNLGAKLIRTKVGDRYVVEKMRDEGYNFGGEQSGHLIFLDYITTGDGILAALQLLKVMIETQKPLSELSKIMESFPQVLHNVKVKEKISIEKIPQLEETKEKFEKQLKGMGRILIRASGTEPVIRIMVEGENLDKITQIARDLGEVIEKHCGV